MEKIVGADIRRKLPSAVNVRIVRNKLSKRKKIIAGIIAGILIIIVAFCGWYRFAYSSAAFIDTGAYQAVFTTNNQAYFGKMQRLNDGAYRLTNVYYLQQAGNTSQRANTDDQSPQLIKMGSELHGPQDAVIFDKYQVLFWENLKQDSKVTKAINDYLKK